MGVAIHGFDGLTPWVRAERATACYRIYFGQ